MSLCPICNQQIDNCLCRENQSLRTDGKYRVVLDHLYFYNNEQIHHLIGITKQLKICGYDDDAKMWSLMKLKIFLIAGMPKYICPICHKSFDDCRCRYDLPEGGTLAYVEVILDHLYLCSDEQLQHIIKLEKEWNLFYNDDRQMILDFIHKGGD